MDFQTGQLVFSKAGRDRGFPLLVLKEEDGWYVISLRGAVGWILK